MNIEVLSCKHCGRLVISVDDTRIRTESRAAQGHGLGKCAGAWTVMVAATYEPASDLVEQRTPDQENKL
jgi:hypothetical protein